MPKTIDWETRENEVLSFIKKNQPVPQGKIVKHFHKKDKTMNATRVFVCKALKRIEKAGKISKEQREPKHAGYLLANIWRTKTK